MEGKVIDSVEWLDWNNREQADFELSPVKLPLALCKSEVVYYEYKMWLVGGYDQFKNHPRIDVLDLANNKVQENYARFDEYTGYTHDKVFHVDDYL